MKKGKLIVIEGACDGMGKSSQLNLLIDYFNKKNIPFVTHHFPSYNTFQGKGVENYLSGKFGQPSELSPYFIFNLYAYDRAITWQTELKREYEAGKIILLDRYTTSSLTYQSALFKTIDEKKAFINYATDFEFNRLGLPKPDKVIYLTAPFDLVTQMRNSRKQNSGVQNDIHETDLSYMKTVYDNSNFVADLLGWTKIICNNKNKMKSIEQINKEIIKEINK